MLDVSLWVPPSLGPAFCVLSGPAAVMVYIVTLAALTTAYVITSFPSGYSFVIFCLCILSAYVCLYEIFTSDTM